MTHLLRLLRGPDVTDALRHRLRLDCVARYHARAAADFAEAGDDASAGANRALAADATRQAVAA